MAHTPGPYSITPTISFAGKRLVAVVNSPIGADLAIVAASDVASFETEGNAHLLAASAAMLSALKKCRVEMEMLRRQYQAEGKGEEWIERQSYLIGECDAAISQAEGRTA